MYSARTFPSRNVTVEYLPLFFKVTEIEHVLQGYISVLKCTSGVHLTKSGTWTVSGASNLRGEIFWINFSRTAGLERRWCANIPLVCISVEVSESATRQRWSYDGVNTENRQ